MNFLRNTEVRRTLLIQGVLSLSATVAAFIWDYRFGIFTLVLAAALLSVSVASTHQRYRRIYDLSADIDRILHGNDVKMNLNRYHEGELEVLQTEIQKMILRLRDQTQQLQDDKQVIIDAAADISHQIRTPLTSANILIQLLTEPGIPEERRIQLKSDLLSILSRIDWLVTTLLKISRLDAGTVQLKQEIVPVQKLISTAVAPLLPSIEIREQTLHINAGGMFCGDVSWTSEAISNIVKNCMEHTPNGGDIFISACETILFTEVMISDTGTGIAEKDLPHIFERFYKGSKSTNNSFGIGLALAKTIIANQNGIIKAENKPDQGALFTVRFYRGVV